VLFSPISRLFLFSLRNETGRHEPPRPPRPRPGQSLPRAPGPAFPAYSYSRSGRNETNPRAPITGGGPGGPGPAGPRRSECVPPSSGPKRGNAKSSRALDPLDWAWRRLRDTRRYLSCHTSYLGFNDHPLVWIVTAVKYHHPRLARLSSLPRRLPLRHLGLWCR